MQVILQILRLVLSLEPAIQDLVVKAVAAARAKDTAALKSAEDAAILLAFEAKQRP